MLYVVPTPVGNLEDITFRALRVLKEVDLILAEDTRTSSVLLKHYDIHTPLKSHHKFNEHETSDDMATRIAAGMTVALISDAGTPCISDPGFMLVRACVEKGQRSSSRNISHIRSSWDEVSYHLNTKAAKPERRRYSPLTTFGTDSERLRYKGLT